MAFPHDQTKSREKDYETALIRWWQAMANFPACDHRAHEPRREDYGVAGHTAWVIEKRVRLDFQRLG